jgi:hypothetical protein
MSNGGPRLAIPRENRVILRDNLAEGYVNTVTDIAHHDVICAKTRRGHLVHPASLSFELEFSSA